MAKLTVRNGILYFGEEVCREVGFNVVGLLAHRSWYQQLDTLHQEQIDVCAANGVRIIRANGMPTGPATSGTSGNWDTHGIPAGPVVGNAYTNLNATFYARQREILDYALSKGVSVIICMMGRMPTLADLKGETQSVGFGSAGSATRTFARTIFANYVNALKDHEAIAAWEINNEWNNLAELNSRPTDSPPGAPTYTDANDKITVAMFAETMAELAAVVKANDPTRAVLSGNAGAWDTNNHGMEGYAKFLGRLNPDPIDTISFHQYSVPANQQKFDNGFEGLREAMQQCKVAARQLNKPVILGEVGVPESLSTKGKDWGFIRELLNDPQGPQITLLWDLNKPGTTLPTPTPDWTIWPGNERSFMLDAVREAQRAKIKFDNSVRRRASALPTRFVRFPGSSCIWRARPIPFSGDFTLGFWARYWNARDPNFGRVISVTGAETNDGFAIQDLTGGSGNGAYGEPYMRIFTTTAGQSVTSRTGYMKFTHWAHYVYQIEPSGIFYNAFYNGFRAAPRYPSGGESAFTGTWVAPTGDFVVGANFTKAAAFWRGDMADLFVVPRKMGEDEIYKLYAYGDWPSDAMRLFDDGLTGWTVVGTPSWLEDQQRARRG